VRATVFGLDPPLIISKLGPHSRAKQDKTLPKDIHSSVPFVHNVLASVMKTDPLTM
jgi:hypothetical protein